LTISKERNYFKNITKEQIYKELVKIFGQENVSDKSGDLYPYSYDMTECEPKMPDFVVIPENKEQLVKLVKYCNQHLIPIVPYISGNNVGGLTIPEQGGIIVDFGKKMNKILHINDNMMYAILEPGVTFGQLAKHLEDNYPHLKYCYPFAPPYAGVVGNALLSGMNNMSCKLGSMGDSINGLEVITADGDVARIGSCFYGKDEDDPDTWHFRSPVPDLMGLFLNWQGMTGLVTKCAVQLWPREPLNKNIIIVLLSRIGHIGEILREVGRSEVCEDVAIGCFELIKMSAGIPEPKAFPEEPRMFANCAITAKTDNQLKARIEILEDTLEKLKEKGVELTHFDADDFIKLFDLRVRSYLDLPAVVLSLVEYSGLTWFGSYAPTHVIDELAEKVETIFNKHNVPYFMYMKPMKYSHYSIFRPILRYNKYKKGEEQRYHALIEEIADTCIDAGCIPYKTPAWMTEKMRKKINPGWIKLFEKIKDCMDPNGIFNPGRWNT
jgi:FAD/FMN-containing dehydrogenase